MLHIASKKSCNSKGNKFSDQVNLPCSSLQLLLPMAPPLAERPTRLLQRLFRIGGRLSFVPEFAFRL